MRKIGKILFGLIFLLQVAAVGGSRIEVKPYVTSSGTSELYLGQVLNFINVSGELKSKLNSIQLGNNPRVGEKRIFTARALAEILRRAIGARGHQAIQLVIPKKIVIENVGNRINEARIRTQLIKAWKELCKDCRLTIESLSMPKIAENLKGAQWALGKISALPKRSFTHRLNIRTRQGRDLIYWVNGSVMVERKVLVTKRAIQFSEKISPEDVVEEYRDTTFAVDSSPSLNSLVGLAVRRSMRAGEVVWHNSLTRERAIKRGDMVKAVFVDGNWNVSLNAIAQEDGYVGKPIKVKNLSSKKILLGKVSSSGEVEIQ